MDLFYDRINDYEAVKIRLASPEDMRSQSYGEVKNTETINYRTFRAEKDGLFCQRIFGPEKDWECFCGKYQGIKYKGLVCDRCGVEITLSRARRKRMGHIDLAAPVVHYWFFKTIPSRLGNILGIKNTNLQRVVYYQDFIVTSADIETIENIDPEAAQKLEPKSLLSEKEYNHYKDRFGDGFEAEMGAEAVRTLLRNMDFWDTISKLRDKLDKTGSKQTIKKVTNRLRILQKLAKSDNDPGWMILDVMPVIPPDLRPLVSLDSGNFATSDLNDLYRRLISRNNRLKHLQDLNAPEVILRNEKRMLQQSVDAIIDNSSLKRPQTGSDNRPLKSLTDMIKGKQGRFRGNLLGKRVDYSARSVIVSGPELKMNECGLPKKIVLEIYEPFLVRKLREEGKADTIKNAKRMLSREDDVIWEMLDEVIEDHPVLLNRAPTLHRMGIQAFQPKLVEGKAIRVHPLVCGGYNADFDGDQMAVHLPLSWEAQMESKTLMMASHNILSPAHGQPIMTPSQDMVLGAYYLTLSLDNEPGEDKLYSGFEEVLFAHDLDKVGTHAAIDVIIPEGLEVLGPDGRDRTPDNRVLRTTPGRIIFNDILPDKAPFYNAILDKGALGEVIYDCMQDVGKEEMMRFLDDLKRLTFHASTISGMSFAITDLHVPENKSEVIKQAEDKIEEIEDNYHKGILTPDERFNQIVDTWTKAREEVTDDLMDRLEEDTEDPETPPNPIHVTTVSGARGSRDQVRQLAGMRGLMARPSGEIIETPIKSNFREGLSVLEYFSSSHGARKGLADTALKTADAGYLTRRLVDVSQRVVVTSMDCGTLNGITKSSRQQSEHDVDFKELIYGRCARDTIRNVMTDELVVEENGVITEEVAQKIEELGYNAIRVRSPLKCEDPEGICAYCYGMDLSTQELVEVGQAVGVVAGQSIGEPGTQLTMRTFHIGGTASGTVEESEIRPDRGGRIQYHNLETAENEDGDQVSINREAELLLMDHKDREVENYVIDPGTVIHVDDGEQIEEGDLLASWDPYNVPIVAENDGIVAYEDVEKDVTMKEEVDPATDITRKIITEHSGEMHPQILLEDEDGEIQGVYTVPEKAHIVVDEGDRVEAGHILAKTPRQVQETEDITGGLPRVEQLFEARTPSSPAVMSKMDGVVELKGKKRGKRKIMVKDPKTEREAEHLVPPGKHLLVHGGDRVEAGEPLIDGPLDPEEILEIKGKEALMDYLLQEIQSVYRSQGVDIDDKHIEIVISQMLRMVKVQDPGDTKFLPGQVVNKYELEEANEAISEEGGKPANYKPVLLGITKAGLGSDSFISAASFEQTTRVLTGAALASERDELKGIKENVILGHLIPAGTGFENYLRSSLHREVEDADSDAEIQEQQRSG